MKRLLYAGLVALTMLFATVGVARADEPAVPTEPTVTISLNPASGATVNPGTSVTIKVAIEPKEYWIAGDIDYILGASRNEVEPIRPYLDGEVYRSGYEPVIIEGKTVLKFEFRMNGPGGYSELFTEYAEYTIAKGDIATPVVKVNGEPYSAENNNIKKEDKIQIVLGGEEDAEIWYTIDGTEPAKNQGTLYTAEFSLTESATVKAIAVNGEDKTSVVVSAPFIVLPSVDVALVDTSLHSIGDTYGKYVSFLAMVMDGENLASEYSMVFYTIDGKTEPDEEAYYDQPDEGPIYRVSYGRDFINLDFIHYPYLMFTTDTVTFKSKGLAVLNGKYLYTDVITKKFTALPLVNPVLSVEAGAVDSGTVVRIKNIDEFTSVYYSLRGDIPAYPNGYNDSRYVLPYDDETGIVIERAVNLRVIGYKEMGEGENKKIAGSDMVVAAYTIGVPKVDDSTGNEYCELAGVNVCPNPSNGEFKVVAPANAQVEIFNAAGVLVKRTVVAEGMAQVRLTHSGIYFVRVMAGNKAAVKRVVVR